MNEDFLKKLDHARYFAGISFKITSGFRCLSHNQTVGGKMASAHTTGHGVDIACDHSFKRAVIVDALLSAGFKRIGICKSFVHVDDDPCLPTPRLWVY